MVSDRVLRDHPRMSLISDGPPSAASLSASSIGGLGRGSLDDVGLAIA